jgi:hypothetical protein
VAEGESMAETQGMTDQQVEELLHALLDFRKMLVSLTDRFQNRLALLEQEFEDYRSAPQGTGPLSPEALKQRPGTAPLEMPNMPTVLANELSAPGEAVFLPEDTDAFSIVDIDDDDDF